jgi:acetyl-CoA C-acetyltransferase
MDQNGSVRDAVILSAVRTASGRFQGSLSGLPATSLGAIVIRAAIERINLGELADIDEVFMGNVVSAGLGQAPARQAAIYSGLPASVGATTINKVCGSSLKTVMLAAQAIYAGSGDLFVCGGMENMSRAPFLVSGRTGSLRFGHAQLEDSLLLDGLWDPFEQWGMGDAAEFIAKEFGISRDAMDKYAYESHLKAIEAIDLGRFTSEIAQVEISTPKKEIVSFQIDETPRRNTSIDSLAKLKPAFQKDGRVTAGNSPGLNDGAAALVVSSRQIAERIGVQPMARIVAFAQAAVEPKYLFDAPAKVIPILLDRTGWALSDVDLIELNEAFAAQVLANGKALMDHDWDWGRVNVNGGAIALGHPIGASGARILTTLLHALIDRKGKKGIAVLCLGGAEAVSIAVEVE